MARISRKAQRLFEQWGRRGGRTRAESLSSHERSMIASGAARARWNKRRLSPSTSFSSVRLINAGLDDPAYLEELLSEGTWEDWRGLYHVISDRPFGDAAAAVEKVCSSAKMYGISALWQGILRSVRGGVS